MIRKKILISIDNIVLTAQMMLNANFDGILSCFPNDV